MKRLRIKTLIACILLGAILAAAGVFLVTRGINLSIEEKQRDMQEILASLEEPYYALESEWVSSEKWFLENNRNIMWFMKALLKEQVSGDQYTGLRVFEDAMVIEIRDGKAILPPLEEDYQYPELTDSFLEKLQAEKDGIVMVNSVFDPSIPEEDADAMYENYVMLNGIPLGGPYYYLNWTTMVESLEYSDIHNRIEDMLNETEIAFGGALFVLKDYKVVDPAMEGETLFIRYGSAVLPDVKDDTEEWEALKNAVQNGDSSVTIDGERYIVFSHGMKEDGQTLVFLERFHPLYFAVLLRAIVVLGLLFLAGGTLLIYLYYTQADQIRAGGEEEKTPVYPPRKVLHRVLAAGITGAVLLAAAAAFIHAVETLQEETLSGRSTMELLLEELKNHQEKTASTTSQEEEEWYVYYGEQMAEVFAKYPELATPDKLQEICDILSIDYIMLFDSRGKETACNKEYSNFTLGTGQGENGSIFRRLLQSVDAIVQPASYDETTNLTRQYIGVSLPDESNVEPQSVLIMALLPEQTARTVRDNSLNAQFAQLAVSGDEYFGVDSADGTILYASEADFIGSSIFRFGLKEQSLKGGYMGFARIDQQGYYVVTAQQNDTVYYYFIDSSHVFSDVVPFALAGLLCFVVLYAVLSLVMLSGYIKKSAFSDPEAEKQEESTAQRNRELFRSHKGSRAPWKKKDPRAKAARIFKLVLLVLIVAIGVYELANAGALTKAGGSLFRFIFFGEWMRGINLFSLCAIILLAILLYVIATFLKWLFRSLPLLFGNRGETVGKLLSSFTNYIAILVGVYFSLEYLGLQPSTILAGLGIAGLAITMGAKDMITDIFAGISIVFEGAFQVGDIIEINGYKGRVLEIGIRTTRIMNVKEDIKSINNRNLTNIVNKTRRDSYVDISLKVDATQDIGKIEQVLNEGLKEISKLSPYILDGPYYSGIDEIDGKIMKLAIRTECIEEHKFDVRTVVNKGIKELFEKNDIKF